jgi:hypothetical protein
MLFSIEEKSSQAQTLATFAVISPSLRIIVEKPNKQPVTASPKANVFQLGDTIFNLDGSIISESSQSVLIPTY